jgi:hypothetical protein
MALNFPAEPVDGQTYENFVWDEGAGVWQVRSSFNLDSLIDVDIDNANEGDLLYYNGAQWVNASAEELNISGSDEDLGALFWMYA